MTNNSGDMTNKISDKRLKCFVQGVDLENITPNDEISMATELLSLRSLNKRLVEDAITLAHQVKLVNDWELDVVEDATSRYWVEGWVGVVNTDIRIGG